MVNPRYLVMTVFASVFINIFVLVRYRPLYYTEQDKKSKDDIKILMRVYRSSKLDELPEMIETLFKKVDQTNAKYHELESHLSDKIHAESSKQLEYIKIIDKNYMSLLQEIVSLKKALKSKNNSAKRDTLVDFNTAPLCDDKEKGSKQVIAYSLFGKNAESYGRFISDVAKEALNIDPYRNFTIRLYVGKTFSIESRKRFKNLHSNVRFCDVRNIPKYGDITKLIGTVWRFIPIADSSIDVFCSRDLDSPLLQRGGDAVNEWFKSNKTFHVMRDRSVHMVAVLGGMWCSRPSRDIALGRELLDIIMKEAAKSPNTKRDQVILQGYVWPKIFQQTLQHDSHFCDSYPGSKPFPTQRREHFVGCVRNCDAFSKEMCPLACRPKSHPEWIHC